MRSLGSGGGAAANAGALFQAQLGAFIGASIASATPLDPRLTGRSVIAEWMRFETEAPLDDILVATRDGGFIAIQAKTTVGPSRNATSPYASAIDQIVRHYLACETGDGRLGWNRRLNPERDRLVLAVGPKTGKSIRSDLPRALQLIGQPGAGPLNTAQAKALADFQVVAEVAWSRMTREPFDAAQLRALAQLINVFVFDPEGADLNLAALVLRQALPAGGPPGVEALQALSARLAASRGGLDEASARQALRAAGLKVAEPADFARDIERLSAHSDGVIDLQRRFESIEPRPGQRVSLARDCQSAVAAAARTGPLLLVGEPGTGKSGVMNALARALRDEGEDVVQLAVDRFSIESLEGLQTELGLDHPLLEVFAAWEGDRPAWLLIDALDATRGGRGEAAFRALIDGVMRAPGRWQVVASIRTFDLRMGRQYRDLFKGAPPDSEYVERGFEQVRHLKIPAWSATEMAALLEQAPGLAAMLATATDKLRDLATVPFNTRLLSDLIAADGLTSDLSAIASQSQLLALYWDHRVVRHGLSAEAALRHIVGRMIEARALRVTRIAAVTDTSAEAIEGLIAEGVLVEVEGRWLQFRHHLLFDYAAARTYIDLDQVLDGGLRGSDSGGLGLMLAPAFGFVLHEIWEAEQGRTRFWGVVSDLLADASADPVIRSAAGRAAVELPEAAGDTDAYAVRILLGEETALASLRQSVGALAVRLEDVPDAPLAPWVRLTSRLLPSGERATEALRFLLFLMLERVSSDEAVRELGGAARRFLSAALDLEAPGQLVSQGIDYVTKTYGTDPTASRALLTKVFAPVRFDRFGFAEVPSLAQNIGTLGAADPDFAAEIFRETFARDVTTDAATRLGTSRILSLTSNARQDYEMARYSLGEFLPGFLAAHPQAAAAAVVDAVEGFVVRRHPIRDETPWRHAQVGDIRVAWRDDHSYIWGHDPDEAYGEDGEALLVTLRRYLRDAAPDAALRLVDALIPRARLAVIWSRLFQAAAERGGDLLDRLWPWAAQEPFLVSLETRKDAVDVLAAGWAARSPDERVRFERQSFTFDFTDFTHSEGARDSTLRRAFRAIGQTNLTTDAARAMAEAPASEGDRGVDDNARLFVLHSGPIEGSPFSWIDDLDSDAPANTGLMTAITTTKAALGLEGAAIDDEALTFETACAAMQSLADALAVEPEAHDQLQRYAEGAIGQGLNVVLKRKLIPAADADNGDAAAAMIGLLELVAASPWPDLQADTEASFEEHASWGGPAPRVEAGEAVVELIWQRPDLYARLTPRLDALAVDAHPAVRLQVAVRLLRLWDIDRDGCWARLEARTQTEPNLEVLRFLVDGELTRLVHTAPETVEAIAVGLIRREWNDPGRAAKARELVAALLAILWVSHARPDAYAELVGWLARPADHEPELVHVISHLRTATVLGLEDGTDVEAEIRSRALALYRAAVAEAVAAVKAYEALAAPSDADTEAARRAMHLNDVVCRELFFAVGRPGRDAGGQLTLGEAARAQFLCETSSLLQAIGEIGSPHTIYQLLQLLEGLMPADPARVFDLLANALQRGGKASGYQFEYLGSELLVRLIAVFLADHKAIFDAPARRAALIACLELFMEAGWPAARRLLYRLPELMQ